MANAKQCDRCRKLYLPYDGVQIKEGGNHWNYILFSNYYKSEDYDLCEECMTSLIKWIKEEDNEERPSQGEWIDTDEMSEYWAEEYQCSICGKRDHWHNFCGNCGADMRGKKKNEQQE